MTTRELIERLQREPPDDEVCVVLEGVYTDITSFTEHIIFADDADKRKRILLLEGRA